MRITFEEEMKDLNKEMINMCNMVETSIKDAICALSNNNDVKAREIMKNDIIINQQEKKIEDICFKILLSQHPFASDLKYVSSALKVVTDMERIGDHASDISELTIMMTEMSTYRLPDSISEMAKESMHMLIEAINSYVLRDEVKAKEVIKYDDIVDKLFLISKNQLIEVIQNDGRTEKYAAHRSADLLMVAKYLERVADHATNIAEWTIKSLE